MSFSPRIRRSVEDDDLSNGQVTPSSPGSSQRTYSRQHNVSPSPAPDIIPALGALRLGDTGAAPRPEDDALPAIGTSELTHRELPQRDRDAADARYPLRQEPLPNAPIYDSRLQDALKQTKAQLSDLYDSMKTCQILNDSTSTLHAIGEQTKRLRDFTYPKTRTVGLVGDSGVGKSSLINSLLNVPGLARSSADGGACTNIVTEYRYLANGQSRFRFEVDYMSSDDINLLLHDLLSTYRAYFVDDLFRQVGAAEQGIVKKKAESAAVAMQALFGSMQGFSEDVLKVEEPDAVERTLLTLRAMSDEILGERPGGRDATTYPENVDHVEDLTDRLRQFTAIEGQNNRPPLWPFVALIRVYVKSSFLQTGIVLADLPGLRDLNYARMRTTDRYMRTCHQVLAVAKIDRVTTDASVADIINRYNQRPLSIVCTHSEAVNAQESEAAGGPDAGEIRALRVTFEILRQREYDLWGAMEQGKHSEGVDDRGLVNARIERIRAKSELITFLMNKRNQSVVTRLQTKYTAKVYQQELRVFCVSNTLYEQASEINDARADLSGIPALRQFCQKIPATAQFNAVAAFLENQVPSLLGSIRQWLVQGSDGMTAQRATELRAELARSRREILKMTDLMCELDRGLKRDFRTIILNKIDQGALQWANATQQTSRVWARTENSPFRELYGSEDELAFLHRANWRQYHHSTYAAFCRNYGDYSTEKATANWNDEIVAPVRRGLAPEWALVIRSATEKIDQILQSVQEVFDNETRALTAYTDYAPNAIGIFLDNLKPRMHCIEDIIDDVSEVHIEQLCTLRNDAMEGYPSSYAVTFMQPAYSMALDEAGRGSDARRKSHIAARLAGTLFLTDLRARCKEAQKTAVDDLIASINNGLRAEVEGLVRDMDVICGEHEVSESRQCDGTAAALQRFVDELGRDMNAQRTLLAELRN